MSGSGSYGLDDPYYGELDYGFSRTTVVNGVVLEKCAIPWEGCRCVVVSPDFRVSQGGSQLELAVEKRLAFCGHPPTPMDIRQSRSFFGVAWRREGRRWYFRSYGTWNTRMEGAAVLRVHIQIPAEVKVEVERTAKDVTDGWAKQGSLWWYSGQAPRRGWTAVVGDPVLRAEAAAYESQLETPDESARQALEQMPEEDLRRATRLLWRYKGELERHNYYSHYEHSDQCKAPMQEALEEALRELADLSAQVKGLARVIAAGHVLLGTRKRSWLERLRRYVLGEHEPSGWDWICQAMSLFPADLQAPNDEHWEQVDEVRDKFWDRQREASQRRTEAIHAKYPGVRALSLWQLPSHVKFYESMAGVRPGRWGVVLLCQWRSAPGHNLYGCNLPGQVKSGPLPLAPGTAEIEDLEIEGEDGQSSFLPKPPHAVLDGTEHAVEQSHFSLSVNEEGFAAGEFSLLAGGRRLKGSFRNLPVLAINRQGNVAKYPEGEPGWVDPPEVTSIEAEPSL